MGGEVSFQEWCDYFHNAPGSSPSFDDIESSLTYKAAFLALWLCCFVVVGGGPWIRPGVLVMASWMAMGRRYALAQPALCSLYYSLRLISTDPVGPSHIKRCWPVHYIIGWMNAYIRNIFGDKMRNTRVPPYNHASKKPMMANIMFRTPKHFSIVEAFNLLCKDVNILWSPYKPNFSDPRRSLPPARVSRIFCLSLHRGMLPWRRANVCIAEPYHPDRVARQFRLDQEIPYLSLSSLYTEEYFGIAHAYWRHLLRPVQNNLHLLPDDDRTGRTTIYWLKWYKKFSEPFLSILDGLSHGIICGRVPYSDRTRLAVNRSIVSRQVLSCDLFVVHKVSEEHRTKYVEFIQTKIAEIDAPWKKILYDFLLSGTLPPVQLKQAYLFCLQNISKFGIFFFLKTKFSYLIFCVLSAAPQQFSDGSRCWSFI